MNNLIDKKGKATIENCRTEKDEIAILKSFSKKAVEENNKRETENDYAIIPIMHGHIKVLLSKYLAHKASYDKRYTGKVRFEYAKK